MATTSAKRDFLLAEAQRVGYIYSKTSLSFRTDLPNLKKQIQDWILEELSFLDKEDIFHEFVDGEIAVTRQSPKLPTNLSVHEISLLMRALMEAGIVSSESITQVLKWAAHNLESKKSKDISPESLRSKYYDPPGVSLKRFEAYLDQMKNMIKSLN